MSEKQTTFNSRLTQMWFKTILHSKYCGWRTQFGGMKKCNLTCKNDTASDWQSGLLLIIRLISGIPRRMADYLQNTVNWTWMPGIFIHPPTFKQSSKADLTIRPTKIYQFRRLNLLLSDRQSGYGESKIGRINRMDVQNTCGWSTCQLANRRLEIDLINIGFIIIRATAMIPQRPPPTNTREWKQMALWCIANWFYVLNKCYFEWILSFLSSKYYGVW